MGLSSYSRQCHISQAVLELTLQGEHHQSQSWGNWDSHIYNCRSGQGHLSELCHLQRTCHCPVPSLRDKRRSFKPKRLCPSPLCLTQLFALSSEMPVPLGLLRWDSQDPSPESNKGNKASMKWTLKWDSLSHKVLLPECRQAPSCLVLLGTRFSPVWYKMSGRSKNECPTREWNSLVWPSRALSL